MKKHSKKIFAALALILALACALTACAPAAASSGNAESKASEAPVSSKAEEKPVALKYLTIGAKPDTDVCDTVWEAANKILLEDLNCTMEVEYLGSYEPSQLALKYAGNEKLDFAYSSEGYGFKDLAKNNALCELKMEDLKKYAPYLVETLPDIAWKQASVGGKIYILPNVNFEYNERAELIRGDLREKYGLDKVNSLDDLEKYLKTIAENEKSMEASGGNAYFQNVWLVEPNGWKGSPWSYKIGESTNPEYFHIAFTDEFMDYAKKMRSFYESGIFAPSLINDSTTMQDKFANGISALDVENTRTINSRAVDINKKHPEWKVEMVYTTPGKKVVPGSFVGNGFVITHTSEYSTKVMEVVNHIYESMELQKLLNWGFEGVNYEMKDGKLYPISDVPADKKFDIGCNWNLYNSVLQDMFTVQETHEGYAEIKEDLAKNSVSNPLAAFSFDKEEVITEVANLTEVEKSYNALNFGMYEDVEGTVAEYRAALKAAGYDKVKAEYDLQVKEFMATYNN